MVLQVRVSQQKFLLEQSGAALVFLVFQDLTNLQFLRQLNQQLFKEIKSIISSGDFLAERGETFVFYTHNLIPFKRLILASLGKRKSFNLENLRQAAAAVVRKARELHLEDLTIVLPFIASRQADATTLAENLNLAIDLTLYKFEWHKRQTKETDKVKARQLRKIDFIVPDGRFKVQVEQGVRRGQQIAQAVNWCRDLINHPGNVFTPTLFAQEARKLAREYKFSCQILGQKELVKEKMGAILGVARGSDEEPQFIILETGPRSQKPIVLIGKGITFDTGGISIKPSERMEEMKMDMAGGAAVLATFKAIALLGLKRHLVGLIPAAENMPSGKAIKPGDVVESLLGKTIEVINTDAEGRLILADALTFADRYQPKAVIDLATLTGAVMIALGSSPDSPAGLFSNHSRLTQKVQAAAEVTGEKVWPMPGTPGWPGGADWSVYSDLMKSEIADLRNVSSDRWAGSITAAYFLKEFIGNWPWLHLDIAGVAWTNKARLYFPAGATGWGVRLLVELIRKWR